MKSLFSSAFNIPQHKFAFQNLEHPDSTEASSSKAELSPEEHLQAQEQLKQNMDTAKAIREQTDPEAEKEVQQLEDALDHLGEPTNEELLQMDVFGVCEALGIDSSYENRSSLVNYLEDQEVYLFDGTMNPTYHRIDPSRRKPGRWYVGTQKQNERLKRNLVENRDLFQNGQLVSGFEKKWQIVK